MPIRIWFVCQYFNCARDTQRVSRWERAAINCKPNWKNHCPNRLFIGCLSKCMVISDSRRTICVCVCVCVLSFFLSYKYENVHFSGICTVIPSFAATAPPVVVVVVAVDTAHVYMYIFISILLIHCSVASICRNCQNWFLIVLTHNTFCDCCISLKGTININNNNNNSWNHDINN